MTLGVMSAAIVSGRVVGRIGARLPIALGLTMTGAGLLLLITVHFDSSYSVQWPWLLLIGLGNGLAMSPMTTAIMSTVPGNRAGMASATSNTMRQTGSVFGIAVLGSIVTSHYIGVLTGKVQAMHLPPIVQERVLAIAAQGRQAMPKHVPAGIDVVAIGRAIGESFTSGLHVGLWVSGLLLLGGVPIALYTIRDTMPGAEPAVANAPATAAVPVAPAVQALPAED
jgi:MFS family permease